MRQKNRLLVFFLVGLIAYSANATPPTSPTGLDSFAFKRGPKCTPSFAAGTAAVASFVTVVGGLVSVIMADLYREECCGKPYGRCCPDSGPGNCEQLNVDCFDCPKSQHLECYNSTVEKEETEKSLGLIAGGYTMMIGGAVAYMFNFILWSVL